ncbi:hypothetical protein ABZT51_13505 [Streptomyces sp. NPDC005373]|uniref:hypothetical protein n=1 Tax=Streptomyces sp. NPDC005373 TaxID=3156879 RepID=UPI0033A3AF57
MVKLLERVASARAEAERETHQRVAHLLTEPRMAELDSLLVVDPQIRASRLVLAVQGGDDSAAAVKDELAKLTYLWGLDAHTLDLSRLPAERRRLLAMVGRRLTPQSLDRREPQRRYPILLTVLAQSATDVLDDAVSLFDQAVSARESRARNKMKEVLAARAAAGENRQALLDEILPVLVDTAMEDEDVGTTEHYGLAINQMRAEGRAIDAELLAHTSPAHSENVNFYGTIAMEVDTEPAKLDPAGYRPLRPRRLAAA